MKKRIAVLLLIVLSITAVSCSDAKFKNDVPTETVAVAAIEAIGSVSDYARALDGYLDDYFTIPDYVSEYTILCAVSGNNIDEIGVFRIPEEHRADMEKQISDYLAGSYRANRLFYNSYIPEETPKLRDAETRSFGNYVVYGILSDASRDAAFRAIESALKLG